MSEAGERFRNTDLATALRLGRGTLGNAGTQDSRPTHSPVPTRSGGTGNGASPEQLGFGQPDASDSGQHGDLCPHGRLMRPLAERGFGTTGVVWCECCGSNWNGLVRPGKFCKVCTP